VIAYFLAVLLRVDDPVTFTACVLGGFFLGAVPLGLFLAGPPDLRRKENAEMLLQRVVYEPFEGEVEAAGAAGTSVPDELRRQVRLEGPDGSRRYISWAWGRGQPDYFIDHAPASFFTGPPAAERDASDDPLWRPLIGRPVSVAHRDATWQVIEIRSGTAVVYCCSFQTDTVLVLREPRPRPTRPGRTRRST
jgi:hypothetical protein